MTRAEIVAVFEGIADILQIKGEDTRRYGIYRRIAGILDSLQEDIHLLYEQNRLIELSGIGKSTVEKVGELIETGQCEYYEELKASIPDGVLDLMSINGVGASTAGKLYRELGIDSLEALQESLDNQKLRSLKGMGRKTEDNIKTGLEALLRYRQNKLMGDILPPVQEILTVLAELDSISEVSLAGGLRRRTETVQNVRIVISCAADNCSEEVKNVLEKTGLAGDLDFQIEFCRAENFGSHVLCATGSEDHIAELNSLADQLGLAPLSSDDSAGWTEGKSEAEIYSALGLPLIAPELRECQGEIQAALDGQLPQLIELSDIRGELHAHSTWSDGADSIETMVEAAKVMGYEYIAICDHSVSSKIANGLTVERVLEKIDEIREFSERISGIKILTGSEVDILNDGSLDYPDEILEGLDVVIASVHSGFNIEEVRMTDRIISAIENRYVNILAHPTGRLLSRREPYSVNVDALIDAAAENRTALEINAYPDRLDLKDIHARKAKEKGVMLSINTDAHSAVDLNLLIYGIYTARRGWVEKKDVLNTYTLDGLMKIIGK